VYKLTVEWIKSLFNEDKTKRAQRELERRIGVYKRLMAIRIANFEHRHGTTLSRRQKLYLIRKMDERIKEMRREHKQIRP